MPQVRNQQSENLGWAGFLYPGPGVLPTPPHQGRPQNACVTVLQKLWAVSEEGPAAAKTMRKEGGGTLNKCENPPQSQAQPPSWLLTEYFLNILWRPPWPRAGCPCLPLPLLRQRTKTRAWRRGRRVTPHPFALAL